MRVQVACYSVPGPAREVIRIVERPRPIPMQNEVLVRVFASGVNPSDVKTRRSGPLSFAEIIPHSDGAGVIEAVGSDVDSRRVGERVWLWNAAWRRAHGTAAEYVALPSRQAVRLPNNTSFEAGACLGIPALTAYRAVFFSDDVRGSTILIAGGAGAVGHYACQMAAHAGATVIATVSSDEKARQAIAAGASHVINYRNESVGDRIQQITGGTGVDRVLEVDLAANAAFYTRCLRRDGQVIVYGSADWTTKLPLRDWLVHGVTASFFIVYELGAVVRERAIADLTEWLEQNRLIHRVSARFSLDETALAHEAVESGKIIGNVVVVP
jgi:NADPH:quinone reductase